MKKSFFLLSLLLALPGCALLYGVIPPQGTYVRGGLPGFAYRYEGCTGNAADGKAWLTFTFQHRLAPQIVYLPASSDAYAVDVHGNRYRVEAANGYTRDSRAGVTERVVLEARGIPPGVDRFVMLCLPFVSTTDGVNNSQRSATLEFRNVVIQYTQPAESQTHKP